MINDKIHIWITEQGVGTYFVGRAFMEASDADGRTADDGVFVQSTQGGLGVTGTGKIEIEVVRDASRFLSLHDEWDGLVAVASVTIFQSFDWQWLWWKYFGDGLDLHILLFRHDNKLIGIAPLYLDVYTAFGLRLRRQLRFMGGGVRDWKAQWNLAEYGPSDYLDIISLPGFESEVGNTFLAYFREESCLDGVELENVPEDGVLMKAVVPQLRLQGYSFSVRHDHVCPRITVPRSLEEYLRGLRSSVRHRLHQARRAYTKEGVYLIGSVSSREEVRTSLGDLIRLHQLRWNRLGYPGMFADDRFRGFLKEVAERFLEKGWLWFKTAQANSSCIAARLGFQFKGCLNDFIAGFDEESPAAKRRPGLALLLSMIDDAIQHRMHTVNLIRGYETYKTEVSSEISYNWKVVVPSPMIQRSFRVPLYRVSHYLEFLLRKAYFEWVMFRVHYREYGLPLFLFHYVTFRAKKFYEKTANMLKAAH
jgi:CelD/BcsL family acetyltransferase involved in cellulose biosynthesis